MALVAIRKKGLTVAALVGVNLVYACTSIFTKLASAEEMFSLPYLMYLMGAVCIMGLYAILWQQVLARIPLSQAYMFKGTSLIFVLLFSAFIFNETITVNNILGSIIIIAGIICYAKA